MVRVAINGLGRIGRAVLKIILNSPDITCVAINDLQTIDNTAYLLKYDTVYGRYPGTISVDGDLLNIGNSQIKMFNSKNPVELPWKSMGIDVVVECTGHFTNREGLESHIKAGAKYAILSAPSKNGGMKTIVPGVNHAEKGDTFFSLASCTTNCITPVIEIMHRYYSVQKAILTTVHAYTSSQAIVDQPEKKWRRGRAAAVNLVPSSTGAAKATTEVITELDGLFGGVAIRAPIPVGSISDIVCLIGRPSSSEEINDVFIRESETPRYSGILAVTRDEIVSSDVIQDSRASIVDLTMTHVVGGNLVKIMSWYDNEWGYASQMVREIQHVGKFLK